MCGPFILPWATVCDSLETYVHLSYPNMIRSPTLYTMLELYGLREENTAGKAVSWSRLLEITRPLIASDPRDKVFPTISWMAHLNPTSERSEVFVSVDYRFDMHVTYLDTANSLNIYPQSGLFLSSLSMKEDHDSSFSQLIPSWVPDWRRSRQVYRFNNDENRFSASGDQSPTYQLRDKKLFVRGCVVDAVEAVGLYLPPRRPHDRFNIGAANNIIFAEWYEWAVARARARYTANRQMLVLTLGVRRFPLLLEHTANSEFQLRLNEESYCVCIGLKLSKQSEDMSLPTWL